MSAVNKTERNTKKFLDKTFGTFVDICKDIQWLIDSVNEMSTKRKHEKSAQNARITLPYVAQTTNHTELKVDTNSPLESTAELAKSHDELKEEKQKAKN